MKAQGQDTVPQDAVLLLIDLVGSTRISERFTAQGLMGTERLYELLNQYFGQVFDAVLAHGGDVIHVDGDATLVMWPIVGTGHEQARRACTTVGRLCEIFNAPGSVANEAAPDQPRFQHRFLMTRGPVAALDCAITAERSFLLATGQAVQETCLGLHGEPDEVVVTDAVKTLLGPGYLAHACGAARWRLAPEAIAVAATTAEGASGLEAAHAEPLPTAQLVRPYLSPVLAERLRGGHAGELSEFRTLTMVYVRVACGPDELVPEGAALQQALSLVQAPVASVAAFVSDVVLGDKGLVVVIGCGLPRRAQEGDAARGLEAALRLTDRLHRAGFSTSVGIATGMAFCGDVGSAQRRVCLTNGPVMYTAARLMQLAPTRAIWVDEETVRVAGHGFDLTPLDLVQAKGLAKPLRPCQLNGRVRPDAHARPLPGALHGRVQELATLGAVMDAVPTQRPLVLIEGEAGAGKTHLLRALQRDAKARHWSCIALSASPFERMRSHVLCRQLILALLGAHQGQADDGAWLQARLSQALAGTPLHEKMALMADVLPTVFAPDGLSAHITGAARLAGVEDILVHLVEQAAVERFLLICVDDLQWVDEVSAQLMLAVSRRASRALVLVAGRLDDRPHEDASGGRTQGLRQEAQLLITLPRLDAAAVSAMLCDTLGVVSVPPALKAYVQARASGLPFHVQQLAISLHEQGRITVQGRYCQAAIADLDDSALPHALNDLIMARVDQLDARHQAVAKVASVVHGAFTPALLQVLLPAMDSAHELMQALDHLVERGLLVRSASRLGAFEFSHSLWREAIYGLLPFQQRERLHRAVAHELEQQSPTLVSALSAELAEHWERGAVYATAMRYRLMAARQAVARFANDDALYHIRSFRQMAARTGVAVTLAEEIDTACMQAQACHQLSRFQEADAWYRQCAQLSGIALPGRRLKLGLSLVRQCIAQVALRLGWLKPTTHPQHRQRHALAAHIFTRLAEHAYFNGDSTVAILHANLTALNSAERAQATRESIEGLGAMAIGMALSGMLAMAERYRFEAVSLARRRGTLYDQGFANLLAGVSAFQAGRWAQAAPYCEVGATHFLRIGDRFRHQTCIALEGYIALIQGQHDRAGRCFATFGPHAEDIDNGPVRAWFLAGWALLDLRRGVPPGLAIERLALARSQPLQRAEELLCDGVEALALMLAKMPTQALRRADAALDLLDEGVPKMGIAVLSVSAVAEVHISLGGRPAQACRALRRFADHAPIGLPLAWQAKAHHAMAQGRYQRATSHWQQALRHAADLHMPLEQARAHLALAHLAGSNEARARHQSQARVIVTRLAPHANSAWHAWLGFESDGPCLGHVTQAMQADIDKRRAPFRGA